MRTTILLLVAFAAFFSSCKNYHYTVTNSKPLVPISRENVVIYTDKSKVPANALEVGIITANSNKKHKVLRKGKKYAAAHGANGIYVESSQAISKSEKVMNSLLATSFKGDHVLIAIYSAN